MSLFRASDPATDADWSVPTPRGPYPVNPSYPDPDGPTQRLYQPLEEPEPLAEPEDPAPYEPHWSNHRRGGSVALAIAVLALFASGGASFIAWSAMGRADEARAMVHPPASAPVAIPSTVATTSPSAATAAIPSPAASGYTVRYARELLQIRVACGDRVMVDLDSPRLDAPERESDVRYDNKCGTGGPLLSVGPGGSAGSHISDPEADAPGCAEAIDTEPLDQGESVPAQNGTVLCVRTGGGRPVLARLEVTALGANGVVSLRATSWTMPAAGDEVTSPPAGDVPSEEAGPGK